MSEPKRNLELLDMLPFMTTGAGGRGVFWRSDIEHPDYAIACATGEGLFATMKRNASSCGMRLDVLLQRVLTDMVNAGKITGVEVGFLTALAEDWARR